MCVLFFELCSCKNFLKLSLCDAILVLPITRALSLSRSQSLHRVLSARVLGFCFLSIKPSQMLCHSLSYSPFATKIACQCWFEWEAQRCARSWNPLSVNYQTFTAVRKQQQQQQLLQQTVSTWKTTTTFAQFSNNGIREHMQTAGTKLTRN